LIKQLEPKLTGMRSSPDAYGIGGEFLTEMRRASVRKRRQVENGLMGLMRSVARPPVGFRDRLCFYGRYGLPARSGAFRAPGGSFVLMGIGQSDAGRMPVELFRLGDVALVTLSSGPSKTL
jgi:hypothetical protein